MVHVSKFLGHLTWKGTIFNCSLANPENTKQHGDVWFISRWVRWQESFQPSLTKGPLWTTSLRDLVWFIWMDPPKTIVEYSRHGEVPWGTLRYTYELVLFHCYLEGDRVASQKGYLRRIQMHQVSKTILQVDNCSRLDPSNGALLVRVDCWKLILIGWNLSMVH